MTHQLNTDIRFSIIPEWVLDAEISDRAVRVYAILARYADSETLQAFPSRETLGKRARCNAKAITRAVEELVAIGAVIKQHRKNGEAYQSNLYTLRRVGPNLTLGGDKPDPRVGSDLTLGGVQNDPLTITTKLEPKERYNAQTEFEHFWALYPRKVGKIAAQKAWAKTAKENDPQTILDGLTRFANDPNKPSPEFLPHPATWLNEGRWEDEPYPAKQPQESKFMRPPAEGPGKREWVRKLHDAGEHFACEVGEFDH